MSGWAALLGGLGLVALGFGLLGFLMLFFESTAVPTWALGNLALGVLLLGAAISSSFEQIRERLRSGEGRRAGKYGTSALLSAALGIAILCMLAFLSTRYSTRFDVSEQRVHTLSDQTQKVVEQLEDDVEVTAFFSPANAPPYRDLLDRYRHLSDRVKVEFADPTVRPDLVETYGVAEQDLARGLIRIGYRGDAVDLTDFDETSITNALVKLSRAGTRKIYFLEGHNERPVEGEGADGPKGMARAALALQNETYRVETLLLAATGEVPEDADALVIAGPTRPLFDPEGEAIERYLARGGGVLVLLDPDANTDLADRMRPWGVQVGDDYILDHELALFGGGPMNPFARSYSPDHEITRELREAVLFRLARSVQPAVEGGDALETIVSTGENSWAERDLEGIAEGRADVDPEDLAGPVSVAIAGTPSVASSGEEDAAPGRLVVFGDSDFAVNDWLDRHKDLFVNSVNWLVGDVENISVRPNKARASRFQLSREQFRRVQYLSLFVVPEAIAIVGVLAWWSRRKRPGA